MPPLCYAFNDMAGAPPKQDVFLILGLVRSGEAIAIRPAIAVAALRAALGDDRFGAAGARGRGLSVAEAIARALDDGADMDGENVGQARSA